MNTFKNKYAPERDLDEVISIVAEAILVSCEHCLFKEVCIEKVKTKAGDEDFECLLFTIATYLRRLEHIEALARTSLNMHNAEFQYTVD